ncbi:MAG: Carboxyl-terminal protease [Candidatus Wolfebacteria bacterium GW2011_GWC1_43_10]|uniref:Carboxyl-terminal protease n=2 Tax=Candidatus Wolfeibacteriota TaxID=1752735 RepID=A0A0G1F743_9BACT|nr:MAG: Carboxyl-terminal protease [Candidatus Wolfebacteria bacterium GW2011_GWC1_43_10]KKT22147.1 MAG: Carboxyl-terminal protease [Parcubacteria group bacterium GW2011_GWB1_43_8b]OGM90085.1 MAG: hypothetical protein A2108_00345 [Candidatus Wolfebacteria bacterium GWA1_42_9]
MRLAKQLVYGVGFLLVLAAFIWLISISFFPSNPSCFDGKKNQGESDVDCGGPCISCEVRSLKNIEVKFVKVFRAADGVGVVAEIYNPNTAWAAWRFDYTLTLKDSLGVPAKVFEEKSFIYAGDLKYLVKSYVPADPEKIIKADLKIKNPQWVPLNQLEKPEIDTDDIKTYKDNLLYVSGKVTNHSQSDFSPVNIYTLIFNKDGELLAGSATVLDNLPKFESKEFKISFSKDWEIYEVAITDFSFLFPRDLKVGDSGKEVSTLQSLLLEMGALDRQPTGFFDDMTRQAVATLQNYLGVPVSGDFDSVTREAVVSLLANQIRQIPEVQQKFLVDTGKTKVFVEVIK